MNSPNANLLNIIQGQSAGAANVNTNGEAQNTLKEGQVSEFGQLLELVNGESSKEVKADPEALLKIANTAKGEEVKTANAAKGEEVKIVNPEVQKLLESMASNEEQKVFGKNVLPENSNLLKNAKIVDPKMSLEQVEPTEIEGEKRSSFFPVTNNKEVNSEEAAKTKKVSSFFPQSKEVQVKNILESHEAEKNKGILEQLKSQQKISKNPNFNANYIKASYKGDNASPAANLNALQSVANNQESKNNSISKILAKNNIKKYKGIDNNSLIKFNTAKEELNFDNKSIKSEGIEKILSKTSEGNSGQQNTEEIMTSIGIKNGVESAKAPVVQSTAKAFDMSSLNASNTETLISKISDYIQQSSIQNSKELDITVRHETLGNFKINIEKMDLPNQVDIKITAGSDQGHKFFVENQSELIKHLNNSGIKLSDLQVFSSKEVGSSMRNQSNSSDSNSFLGHNSKEGAFNFGKDTSQGKGQNKRQELWNEYKERYFA